LDNDEREKVIEYSKKLEEDIVKVVSKSIQSLKPAYLYTESGVARFAVNRRNNPSWQHSATTEINELTELSGPIDHDVPVIKVEDNSGSIMAILFGYACHPTATPIEEYKLSGDWPGYAQLELENVYPGAKALFFLGAAGDIDPMPRQTEAIAEQYGREIAASVIRVINEEMRPLNSIISNAYSEIELELNTPPSYDELLIMEEEFTGRQKNWATFMLNKLREGKSLRTSYPYPILLWKLGDQPIFGLGGELVVDYAIAIKRIFGQNTIVMGYSNDVMSYIPTARIIREGGYEGAHSQMVRAMPNTWKPNIEIMILSEVLKMAEELGLSQAEYPLMRN
jgi:neutral ceramidase